MIMLENITKSKTRNITEHCSFWEIPIKKKNMPLFREGPVRNLLISCLNCHVWVATKCALLICAIVHQGAFFMIENPMTSLVGILMRFPASCAKRMVIWSSISQLLMVVCILLVLSWHGIPDWLPSFDTWMSSTALLGWVNLDLPERLRPNQFVYGVIPISFMGCEGLVSVILGSSEWGAHQWPFG